MAQSEHTSMDTSMDTSILHPIPHDETINLANNASPTQPALKKRKLNENGSIVTSASNSNNSTSNNSSDTTSDITVAESDQSSESKKNKKKRKRMDIDSNDSKEDNNDKKKTKKKKKKKKKKKQKKRDIFSMYAIKKMLKADETLNDFQISSEAATIIGKATHFFMDELLKESISKAKNNTLRYDNIASYVDSKDKLSFLNDIVPKRVLYGNVSNNNLKNDTNQNHNNTNNKTEQKNDK